MDTASQCDEKILKYHLKQDLLFLAYVMRLPRSPIKSALRLLQHLQSDILFHHIARDQTPPQLPIKNCSLMFDFKSEAIFFFFLPMSDVLDNVQ